jgi:hypothetical protein
MQYVFRPHRFAKHYSCMPNQHTITLFRPVGQRELDLIEESGWTAFPPRLDWQPIFYPVLNEEYATFIAREWNTRDLGSDFVGYVLRFNVLRTYLAAYKVQQVGSLTAREYWIPSEELPAFNSNIVGKIEIVSRYGELDVSHPDGRPLISEPEMNELAAAWINHRHLYKGDQGQIPFDWAPDLLGALMYDGHPEEVWRAILAIHRLDHSRQIQMVLSAGLIEELLSKYGDRFIARIEREAEIDSTFAQTLGGVWKSQMSDENWQRLQAVWDRRGWDGLPE